MSKGFKEFEVGDIVCFSTEGYNRSRTSIGIILELKMHQYKEFAPYTIYLVYWFAHNKVGNKDNFSSFKYYRSSILKKIWN